MQSKIENDLIDLLHQVKEVFDKHNIEFWLECGTLLGAVREGVILPWEHDIDFGAWLEKVPRSVQLVISKEFNVRNFKVFIDENHMTIKKNTDAYADINFYQLKNEYAIVSLSVPTTKTGERLRMFFKILIVPYYYDFLHSKIINYKNICILISRILPNVLRRILANFLEIILNKIDVKDVSWIVPDRFFEKFSTIKFYGMEFKIPSKTSEYLEFRYGKDWKIPRKYWVTEQDDGAVAISTHKKYM